MSKLMEIAQDENNIFPITFALAEGETGGD